ncbi:MAG: phage terminase small subunit P27 family [Chloroflexi bacterium]|nr:phage terminase small subunit P27 family [Chloroflexota bacterium]
MVGRRPKPTALREVEGNAGHRPLPKSDAETTPLVGVVEPPKWLSERGREVWAGIVPQLQAMRVLTAADLPAVYLLCSALAEQIECEEVITREGPTYETVTQTGSTIRRPRPERAMAADAWRRARLMMIEFGLTSAARTRVSAAPEPAAADPLAEFIGGDH